MLVDVAGATLWADVSGDGAPLVFIPGFTLDHRVWDPQVAAFSAQYWVLRYDQRGFGRSSMPSEAYSHAEDVAALLRHFKIGSAHVVALSVGAVHALELALLHPGLVRSLALVDCAGLGPLPFPPDVQQMFARIKAAARGPEGVEVAKRIWRAGGWFAPALERPEAARLLDAQLSTYSGWHWLNDNPARSLSPPIHERLSEITAPTLVVVGERDLAYDHQLAELLTKRLPHAIRRVLPGVGHFPPLEDPEAFNAALLSFLESVPWV
ncbi:MAG TPA: alpha/beta fold hydrolase [Polyangiaceae bacterium]